MKPIAVNSLCIIPAGNRQETGHAGHVPMERRIKTSYLRQIGKPAMKRLGQLDLFRQVLRIERLELMQLLNQLPGDALWFAVLRAAMHYAMPYCGQLVAS